MDWTEEGHRFAWRMKLRYKEGQLAFDAQDARTGQRTVLQNLEGVLTDVQERMMLHDPEMIRQFGVDLEERFEETTGGEVEVRALNRIAFNGREPRPMVAPKPTSPSWRRPGGVRRRGSCRWRSERHPDVSA